MPYAKKLGVKLKRYEGGSTDQVTTHNCKYVGGEAGPAIVTREGQKKHTKIIVVYSL